MNFVSIRVELFDTYFAHLFNDFIIITCPSRECRFNTNTEISTNEKNYAELLGFLHHFKFVTQLLTYNRMDYKSFYRYRGKNNEF